MDFFHTLCKVHTIILLRCNTYISTRGQGITLVLNFPPGCDLTQTGNVLVLALAELSYSTWPHAAPSAVHPPRRWRPPRRRQLLLDRRQALQCKAVLLLELLLQHLVVALAHGRIVSDHRLDGFRNGRFQPGQLLLQLVQLSMGVSVSAFTACAAFRMVSVCSPDSFCKK